MSNRENYRSYIERDYPRDYAQALVLKVFHNLKIKLYNQVYKAELKQEGALVTRAGVRSGLQILGRCKAQAFDSPSGAHFFLFPHP